MTEATSDFRCAACGAPARVLIFDVDAPPARGPRAGYCDRHNPFRATDERRPDSLARRILREQMD